MNRTIVAGIFLLLLCINTNLLACSCMGKLPVKESVRSSDLVFRGKVIAAEELKVPYKLLGEETGVELSFMTYTMEVLHVYKGKKRQKTVQVRSGVGKGDCGFQFQIGEVYVIYSKLRNRYFPKAAKVEKFHYTDVCTRTTRDCEEEEKELFSLRCTRRSPQ